MIIKIILACILIFVSFETFHLICWVSKSDAFYLKVYKYFAQPISIHRILLQPWSILSFMFMHADVSHILWNMLFLFWFGEIYQIYMREKRILPLFVFGSLAGAALCIIMCHLLPPLRPSVATGDLVGASAGVQAIMFAATALHPEHRVKMLFIGYIPLKYVSVGFLLMDYLALTYGNPGGMIAHLGGSIFGYLYIKSLQSGTDWFKPLDKIMALFKPKSKLKATYVNTTDRRAEPSVSEQKKLDMILDKIAKSGYNSLSKEEKEFLFRFSNK
jgi:membrane associated rhomboid family serine protease